MLATEQDTGLDVADLQSSATLGTALRQASESAVQMERMERIARAFVDQPATIHQELVDAAVALCGADSAGISVEMRDRTDEHFYHWIATAGQYSNFMDAVLPRYPSACGICLERGRPQRFRVRQPFFDRLGISAPLITDGLLLPWETDETRGTIFVMAHGRDHAFDEDDCRILKVLADFASLGMRDRRRQVLTLEQARTAAAAAMANRLAHEINNPLQSLTNILYLAAEGNYGEAAKTVGLQASDDMTRLTKLVKQLLILPIDEAATPSVQ